MKNLIIDFSNVEIYEKYKNTILSNEILFLIFTQADLPIRARIVLSFGKKFFEHFAKISKLYEKPIEMLINSSHMRFKEKTVNGIGIGLNLLKIDQSIYSEKTDRWTKQEYYMLNDEKHGHYISYHDEDCLHIEFECNYKDGILNGEKKVYFRDKLHEVYNMKDGKREGPYIRYMYMDIYVRKPFKKGSYVEHREFYRKCTYVDGFLEGISRKYHKNDLVKSQCLYEKGIRQGLYEKFDTKGNRKYECIYVNGCCDAVFYKKEYKNKKWRGIAICATV